MEDKKVTIKERIIKYLEQGLWFRDACIAAGSSEASGHRYKNTDESFKSRCEAAIIKYKAKLITCVNIGATKDARIAIEVLKTRWPEEWNPKSNVPRYDPQEELQRIHELIYGEKYPSEVH